MLAGRLSRIRLGCGVLRGVVGFRVLTALGDVCANCRGDYGAEVGAEAIEMLQVFCAARVGEAEGKERFPGVFYLAGAAAHVEGEVLGEVGGHVCAGCC